MFAFITPEPASVSKHGLCYIMFYNYLQMLNFIEVTVLR